MLFLIRSLEIKSLFKFFNIVSTDVFSCCEEKEKDGKYSLGSNLYIAHLNQAD